MTLPIINNIPNAIICDIETIYVQFSETNLQIPITVFQRSFDSDYKMDFGRNRFSSPTTKSFTSPKPPVSPKPVMNTSSPKVTPASPAVNQGQVDNSDDKTVTSVSVFNS